MARHKKMGRRRILHRLVGAVVVFVLGPQGWAQNVSPALLQAAQAAYQQEQQEEPQLLPLAEVDPKLVGKKVEVHYRDGRTVKGKLTELTPDFIELERQGQIDQIPLSQVARVSQQKSTARRTWIIVGVSAAAVGLSLLIGAMTIQD
jgi:hypothetical protein